MRELRSCDFCGADAAGVYEPLPPDLAAERRRVALCSACRATLADLLEPLQTAGGQDLPDTSDTRDTPDATGEESERSSGERPARAVTVESADPDRTDENGGGEDDEGGGDDRDAGLPSGGGGASESERTTGSGGRPRGYRKLIRLVSNRESAVPRADLTEVAISAYGIDAEQADRALEAAVANGDLIEEGGRLRVP